MTLDLRRLQRMVHYLFEDMRQMTDDNRDLPMLWSTMHMFSTIQLAVLSAIKSGLDPEICGISAALHDIATVQTGITKQHAKRGGPFVHELIDKYNSTLRGHLPPITEEERDIIHDSVINHSAKRKESNNVYVEMMKQVDSLDHFLYGLPVGEKEVKHVNTMFELFNIDMKV